MSKPRIRRECPGLALEWSDRTISLLGARPSSVMLVWLASHRNRLQTLVLGGHRLSILVVWDRDGQKLVDRSEAEIAAMALVAYGPTDAPA